MKSLGWVLVALCTYNTAYGRQDSAPTHYYSLLTDTTKLSEVQIQQNRLHLPFSKQSRNIQIITSEDIQKLPGSSLNEILQFANGVDIRQRGPFGSQADISIDGGSFEQTIVLLNGVKMADPQTAHHALNLPIPIDAIERIEIIRGPASRIYGINSLTGAINIVTKTTTENSLQAHAYVGSSFQDNEEKANRKYYGAGGQIGGTWYREKHNHLFAYNYQKSSGQRYNTASENNKLYYQGEYVPNSANQLNWAAGYIDNKFGANGFYSAPGDKEAEEKVETVFVSISSKHQLTPKLSLSPRISSRYNEDDYRYFRTNYSKNRYRHYTNSWNVELNGLYNTSIGNIGMGYESRWESINSTSIGQHKRNNQGAYLEFQTEQIPRLMISTGAYINYNSDYGWEIFPGLDLGYDLSNSWKLILNAGTSQRIPSFTDLYLQQTGNVGNPDLKSENAYQIETGIKYLKNDLIAQLNIFTRDIHNFIDKARPSELENYSPYNMGKNKTKGINTSLQYKFSPGLQTQYRINIGYNYLSPSFKKENDSWDSKYFLESLRHQAIANLTFQHRDWSFTTANRFQERISYKSYFLSDIKLAYQLRNIHLYIDAQNIFDVSYIESGAVPMPGRWYSIGVKLNQVFRK